MNTQQVERITGWRQSQLSIARFYGSVRIEGVMYVVCPVTDDLVRDDIYRQDLKDSKKLKQVKAAEKKKWNLLQQQNMFGVVVRG